MRNDRANTVRNAAGHLASARAPAQQQAQSWAATGHTSSGEDDDNDIDWEELRARASLDGRATVPRSSEIAPRGTYADTYGQEPGEHDHAAHVFAQQEDAEWPSTADATSDANEGGLWNSAAAQQQAEYDAWHAQQQAQQQAEYDAWHTQQAQLQAQAQQQAEYDAWHTQQAQLQAQAQQQAEYDAWHAQQAQAQQQAEYDAWHAQQQAQQQAEYDAWAAQQQYQPQQAWAGQQPQASQEQWAGAQAPQQAWGAPQAQPAWGGQHMVTTGEWSDEPVVRKRGSKLKTLMIGGIGAAALAFGAMRLGIQGSPQLASMIPTSFATVLPTSAPPAQPSESELAARAAALNPAPAQVPAPAVELAQPAAAPAQPPANSVAAALLAAVEQPAQQASVAAPEPKVAKGKLGKKAKLQAKAKASPKAKAQAKRPAPTRNVVARKPARNKGSSLPSERDDNDPLSGI